jgi:hypothetical protein
MVLIVGGGFLSALSPEMDAALSQVLRGKQVSPQSLKSLLNRLHCVLMSIGTLKTKGPSTGHLTLIGRAVDVLMAGI